ncbi:hypothetical protein WJU23_05390 [Prosthecobacter sp. SYSU 5D2]|uniref:hypothetical protein n=1 Tax=Prosthecobacter sp. SYSU 5D2 TaxID=3134134 RepID=UPI0031FE803C
MDEAWGALDDLPSESQVHFPVLALRVQILIAAKSWLKAEILAESLTQVMPTNGPAWYALAKALAQQEKISEAQAAAKRACELEPDLKLQILNDDALKGLF